MTTRGNDPAMRLAVEILDGLSTDPVIKYGTGWEKRREILGWVTKATDTALEKARAEGRDEGLEEARQVCFDRGHQDKLKNLNNRSGDPVAYARYGAWLDAQDAIRALAELAKEPGR